MDVLYDRTLPSNDGSSWDFSGPAPDAVVINLSTNDFVPGVPDQGTFVDAYAGLLAKIRSKYPRAHLFAAVGPMMSDNYPEGQNALSNARSYLQAALAKRTQAGDPNVHFVEFPVQTEDNGYGCDYHPSKATHKLMADQLATTVRSTLHW